MPWECAASSIGLSCCRLAVGSSVADAAGRESGREDAAEGYACEWAHEGRREGKVSRVVARESGTPEGSAPLLHSEPTMPVPSAARSTIERPRWPVGATACEGA